MLSFSYISSHNDHIHTSEDDNQLMQLCTLHLCPYHLAVGIAHLVIQLPFFVVIIS